MTAVAQCFWKQAKARIIVLRLKKPTTLTIGRLGVFKFPAGWYTYIGSAFGPSVLGGRLTRHLVAASLVVNYT